MTFPATQTSCLFYCRSTPEFELKPGFCRAVREPRKTRLSLKSGNPLSFSDFEGDLTPSDFELNFQPQFAKTYAYHFSISAKCRPLPENEKALRISRYDRYGGHWRVYFSRKSLRCSSQLSGMPRRSLSSVKLTGWRFSHIAFTMSGARFASWSIRITKERAMRCF